MLNYYNVINYIDNQSLGSSFNGQAVSVGNHDHIAIQYVVSEASTLTGSIQLQKSLDGSSWVNLGSAIAISSNVVGIITEADVKYGFLRLVYTASAGSGLMQVKIATINDSED